MTIDFTTEDEGVSDRWTPIATRFCGGSIDPQSVQIPDISSAGIKDAPALTAPLRSNCLLSKWIPLES